MPTAIGKYSMKEIPKLQTDNHSVAASTNLSEIVEFAHGGPIHASFRVRLVSLEYRLKH